MFNCNLCFSDACEIAVWCGIAAKMIFQDCYTILKIDMLRKPHRHKRYFCSTLHVSLGFFYPVNVHYFT